MAKKKAKGKGRGWHGDSAGHSAAARKSGRPKKGKTGGKTPAEKLGMTKKDLAKIPGTKAHHKAKVARMGLTVKQHNKKVRANWKRMT